MKPEFEQRNNQIRDLYKTKLARLQAKGEKDASSMAIEELVRDFKSWHLDFETIRRIIYDPGYGKKKGKGKETDND